MNLAALLLFLVVPTQRDSILDPTTWRSPSGEFELAVDPCRPDGGGSAVYGLTHLGRQVWSGEKPFTLWRAAVTDEGITIGYAYTNGIISAKGELQGIRIGPDGGVKVCASSPRRSPWAPHGGSWPVGGEILLQPDTDRAVIEMLGREKARFWYLRISTGEALPPFMIDGERSSWKRPEAVEPPRGPDLAPEPPLVPLPALGSFAFDRSRVADPEIRDIDGFSIDDRGRLGWVRPTPNSDAWELALVDPQGLLVARVALGHLQRSGQVGGSRRPRLAWTQGDRWLVTVFEPGEPGRSFGWLVDVEAGDVREAAGFRCPEVWELAALPGGGVAALVNRRTEHTSESTLMAFDREANPTWKVGMTRDPADHARLFSPKSLTVTSDGRVVVLDGVLKILQVFDHRGSFLTSIDLRESWGLEPDSLVGLAADGDAGLLVVDFRGSSRIRRTGPAGEIRASFVPRWSDGRILTGWPIVRARDGSLWTCEEDSLLRLSDDGVVDRVIGDGVHPGGLGDLHAVEVDLAGRLYARGGSSPAVHVFDSDGASLRICRPEPRDFDSESYLLAGLSTDPEGRVYIQKRNERRRRGQAVRHLGFDPDGRRLGWFELGLDWLHEAWRFKHAGGERWVLGYRELFLVAADGTLKRRIDRQPDRRWLRSLKDAAVAPDGSVALLTAPRYMTAETEYAVHLYDAEGEPIRSFELPSDVRRWHPALVWTGKWLVVARDAGRFLLIEAATDTRRRFQPMGVGTDRGLDPFLSGGGRELWLVDRGARSVRRFSLPGH